MFIFGRLERLIKLAKRMSATTKFDTQTSLTTDLQKALQSTAASTPATATEMVSTSLVHILLC